MPLHRLPDNPDLEHLRNQAKELRRSVAAGLPHALERIAEFHPRPLEPEKVKLADAQLVIARMYGFPSWPRLVDVVATIKRHSRSPHRVPASTDLADEFLRLPCLTYGADYPGRTGEADDLLEAHPELATANVCTLQDELATVIRLLHGRLGLDEGGVP